MEASIGCLERIVTEESDWVVRKADTASVFRESFQWVVGLIEGEGMAERGLSGTMSAPGKGVVGLGEKGKDGVGGGSERRGGSVTRRGLSGTLDGVEAVDGEEGVIFAIDINTKYAGT